MGMRRVQVNAEFLPVLMRGGNEGNVCTIPDMPNDAIVVDVKMIGSFIVELCIESSLWSNSNNVYLTWTPPIRRFKLNRRNKTEE